MLDTLKMRSCGSLLDPVCPVNFPGLSPDRQRYGCSEPVLLLHRVALKGRQGRTAGNVGVRVGWKQFADGGKCGGALFFIALPRLQVQKNFNFKRQYFMSDSRPLLGVNGSIPE